MGGATGRLQRLAVPSPARHDGHAHVFAPDLPFVTPRRYTPAYAATAEGLVAHLDAHGLTHGLLTQPSFLGTDNTHMLAAVARFPGRLKAVVVVDDRADDAHLDALQAQGAIGIRFNLSGVATPPLREGRWPQVLRAVAARGWHVEVFGDAVRLADVIDPALEAGARVCVDHFGKPAAADPLGDAGFRRLLAHGAGGRVWVKLSAAYRCGGAAGALDDGERVSCMVAPALVDHFGPARLLWGSDWPHTQHESVVRYADTFAALARWVPDATTREAILQQGGAALFDGVGAPT
jgi:predicted TIM-barrel fold metal-dependent hydrolase